MDSILDEVRNLEDKYELIEEIGFGSSGTVYRATMKSDD